MSCETVRKLNSEWYAACFSFFNVIVAVFVMVDIKMTEKHRGKMFYCEVIFTALGSGQAENFQRIRF